MTLMDEETLTIALAYQVWTKDRKGLYVSVKNPTITKNQPTKVFRSIEKLVIFSINRKSFSSRETNDHKCQERVRLTSI